MFFDFLINEVKVVICDAFLFQVSEPHEQTYQVPKVELVSHTVQRPELVQVPKQIMVPQVQYETQVIPARTIQVPRPVYETRKRTIQVPKVVLETKEIEEQYPAYETKTTTVQVPRTVLEPQVVTSYTQQVTQEPVTVQVPITQTQIVAQQINKVIEYKREPVNTYTVAGGYYPVGQPQISAAQSGYTGYTGYTAGAVSGAVGQVAGGAISGAYAYGGSAVPTGYTGVPAQYAGAYPGYSAFSGFQ